ncbi:glycosyltransferase [Paracoccus jeotgali]|uniref:Glycosyl transferase n=1 Tax=Paracoccus jeotgali TaxID=2065379 RepID=A0A2K9MHP2_9RHOB|nr:glycosyltransferase [Paracoccus jeotgali]AUM74992.1 glycosyl transferase [Paracoccus jeotgali]
MLSRLLLSVFNRYARRHGRLRKPGFMILDRSGRRIGQVDDIMVEDGRLRVKGWAVAERVGLGSAEQQVESAPSISRRDVRSMFGDMAGDNSGFILELPLADGPASVWIRRGAETLVYPIAAIRRRELALMRLRQIPPFARDVIRASPAALAWLRRRDAASAVRIKAALGLNDQSRPVRIDAQAFAPDDDRPLPGLPGGRISIIVPIYDGFDLLPEVLGRVLRHTDLPFHLILIEDASPDPRVRPWLRDWVGQQDESRVTLLENDSNLGFIQSVNRGFQTALVDGGHVVLLNADALVPQGWASRLLAPIRHSADVASVTPMSNDAEIFNAPVITKRSDLAPGQLDAMDALLADRLGAGQRAEAPTGVGFCMAMNVEYLRALPEFDTSFGKGYGEEVDWCQRARLRGGRNLGLGGLFVEHRGGVSFGSEAKQQLMRQNSVVISTRYPQFDAQVQSFIRNDPLLASRLAWGLAWAATRGPDARGKGGRVRVYLVHDMGGGAEHDAARRARLDLKAGDTPVMLRVGGLSRWQIELATPIGVTRAETDDTELMLHLLNLVPEKTVIYSCGVGDRDPMSLPDILLALCQGSGDRLEVLFHDYFPLSPSYTLLDSDEVYRGVPEAETNTDPAHELVTPDGQRVTLAQWRAAWGRLMARADRLEVFSDNGAGIVAAAYPDHAAKIAVTPHRMLHVVPELPKPAPDAPPVIGVLGNIGLHKGATVLRDLSALLARSGQAQLAVIGSVDPSYPLAPSARVHGHYKPADIPALVSRYGITCWLIPSIVPETFSFTTHECLATGLPVWAFDLGAQGDSVASHAAERGQGGVLPIPQGPGDLQAMVDSMTAS